MTGFPSGTSVLLVHMLGHVPHQQPGNIRARSNDVSGDRKQNSFESDPLFLIGSAFFIDKFVNSAFLFLKL